MGTLRRLVGVYEADGGLAGELRYVVRKLSGRGHCSLCDITHRGVRAKPAWRALCDGLPVPFDLAHLNQRDAVVTEASDGRTPCVLAEVDGALVYVLGPVELERCGGDVARFEEALRTGLSGKGITLP